MGNGAAMNNAVHYEDALMVKAAWYYYFENMTQQAIADRLSISRMRVIKLLDDRAAERRHPVPPPRRTAWG